jgi:GH15 family glucan-1,4-alpha-glucosidase
MRVSRPELRPAEMARDGARGLEDYLPIAEHGLIGDLHTAALVGTDGTIDWYCCPRFDAPSVFAAILDRERGGHYRIAPMGGGWTAKQLYLPDTNVLITRFLTPTGWERCRTSCRSRRPVRPCRVIG